MGALAGIHVLEIGEGVALAYAGKLLRDLGAEVIKVEPASGDSLRDYGPFPDDSRDPEQSGLFIYNNSGKRGARLDIASNEGRKMVERLLPETDVLLHSFRPKEAEVLGFASGVLSERFPNLIVAAVTTFGSTGPYADWRGYPIHAQAGSGVAFRIGEPGREPLTAPFDAAATQHGGVQAAAAVALALRQRHRTDRAQFVDVATMDAVTHAVTGAGLGAAAYGGRPPVGHGGRRFGPVWGLFATKDGDFEILSYADWHWQAFLKIMGEPEWAQDPIFRTTAPTSMGSLTPEQALEWIGHLEDWCAGRTNAEIWALTRAAEITFQPVQTISQAIRSEQLSERGFLEHYPGSHPPLTAPGPAFRMSRTPALTPGLPPALDEASSEGWLTPPCAPMDGDAIKGGRDTHLPLAGVRVLDLSIMWAGPQLGRFLGDYGAEVIVVETTDRPRLFQTPSDASEPRAWESIYRNRRSIQLNLKTDKGREMLGRLLGQVDVVIDNFSPEVLEKLGFGYESVIAEHPGLIMAALSAVGRHGPWSGLRTMGPTLTALYGLKSMNGYPEDGIIVEDPSDLDPVSASYGMLAIVAALHHRDHTGEGQMIEIAQGELGLCGAAEAIIEFVWNGRELGPQGNQHSFLAPHGIYPCTGDDRWIAIACGSDAEWEALARAAGHPEWLAQPSFGTVASRRAARAEIDSSIAEWTQNGDADALAETLQGADVAALPVMSAISVIADPQHTERRAHFRLNKDFPVDALYDGNPWHLSDSPPALSRPAPAPGQDNVELYEELLGLSGTEVAALEEAGVIC